MIMLRTLRKDLSRYNELDSREETADESGWKLVHGDIFRPPQRPALLSVYVGTGVQYDNECHWFAHRNCSARSVEHGATRSFLVVFNPSPPPAPLAVCRGLQLVVAGFLDVWLLRAISLLVLAHLHVYEDGHDAGSVGALVCWLHADCIVLVLHAHWSCRIFGMLRIRASNLWSSQGGVGEVCQYVKLQDTWLQHVCCFHMDMGIVGLSLAWSLTRGLRGAPSLMGKRRPKA
eukprot:scaffold240545_cov36-Tisochrysis_lutea.AAC.1